MPGHCLIIPAEHCASSRQADEHVWTEMRNFKKCLLQMYVAEVGAVYKLVLCNHIAQGAEAGAQPQECRQGEHKLSTDQKESGENLFLCASCSSWRRPCTSQTHTAMHCWQDSSIAIF